MKSLIYTPFILLLCVFISCNNRNNRDEYVNNVKDTDSGISLVGRYEIKEGGMNYVVYRESDGGLFILNITKDSLTVEHLKN